MVFLASVAWAWPHLEFLLGYKVLHAPDDLDGGPMVLPQSVEEGEQSMSSFRVGNSTTPVKGTPAKHGQTLQGLPCC